MSWAFHSVCQDPPRFREFHDKLISGEAGSPWGGGAPDKEPPQGGWQVAIQMGSQGAACKRPVGPRLNSETTDLPVLLVYA